MGIIFSFPFLSFNSSKVYEPWVFVISRFLPFQERASSSKGHESPPIRLNEGDMNMVISYGRGRKGDSKLVDALGAMGMEVVLGCSNEAVEPRMHVLILESRYGLGLVK
ncbi:hypothetical protein PIB30_062996, partial [Stylosanthes scabra]|nr:hypothetical protein [Stylosanthes scabra]